MDEKIDKLLHYDALYEAEQATGTSYKEDGATSALGFVLSLQHAQEKEKQLSALGDSYSNISFGDFLCILADLGFKKIYSTTINRRGELNFSEIYWHSDGILLTVDSFNYAQVYVVNRCNLYYNWVPSEEYRNMKPAAGIHVTSSGSYYSRDWDDPKEPIIWAGSHDGREGIRHKLAGLREYGTFLPVWEYAPHVWLIDFGEEAKIRAAGGEVSCGWDMHNEANFQKFQKLPREIQDKIFVVMREWKEKRPCDIK